MNVLDFPFSRRLTLVKALSILATPSEMQRRVDAAPLSEDLQKSEEEARRSAFAKYGYMSSVEKTVEFTRALARVLRAKEKAGHIEPANHRYEAAVLIVELTMARQSIDKIGLPYDLFAIEAIRYWVAQRRHDTPSLVELFMPYVITYVLERWADPAIRSTYPWDVLAWDQRFRSGRRAATDQHRALHEFIAQRVADAVAMGRDPAKALRPFLQFGMPEQEAVRRFGTELVEKAKQAADPIDTAIAEM
jgi:hypothetical protein